MAFKVIVTSRKKRCINLKLQGFWGGFPGVVLTADGIPFLHLPKESAFRAFVLSVVLECNAGFPHKHMFFLCWSVLLEKCLTTHMILTFLDS